MEANIRTHILFFDGVCTLCNTWVDRLMRWDKHAVLKFASLQGETAKQWLPQEKVRDLDSVCYYRNEKVFVKSRAALEVLRDLGGAWSLFYIFRLVPPILRDAVYDSVARNRYRWFGKRETCRMPSPEEAGRILD